MMAQLKCQNYFSALSDLDFLKIDFSIFMHVHSSMQTSPIFIWHYRPFVRVSVCPSHAGIVWIPLNVSSKLLRR